MSYIEKEKLIKADMASIENKVRHAFNQGYDLGFKEGKKICEHDKNVVLDKIKSEISRWVEEGGNYSDAHMLFIKQIIDSNN